MSFSKMFLPQLPDSESVQSIPDAVYDGDESTFVRLYAAPLPKILGRIALHCSFGLRGTGESDWQRWEVWQRQIPRAEHWGHVHKNLMRMDNGVGGGAAICVFEWHGDEAARIAAVLGRPEAYPHRGRYLAFPGPNSNTYVAWVLKSADIQYRLPILALGHWFPARALVASETPDVVVR